MNETSPAATHQLQVVLHEPQIAPNTGNIARLCAANGVGLTLVGKLGFTLDDRQLKRAGLDYWQHVHLRHAPSWKDWTTEITPARLALFSTHASVPYTALPAKADLCLVFGKETRGLPQALLQEHAAQSYTIPMLRPVVRSLNLASAVAIVLYDVLRRLTLWEPQPARPSPFLSSLPSPETA